MICNGGINVMRARNRVVRTESDEEGRNIFSELVSNRPRAT